MTFFPITIGGQVNPIALYGIGDGIAHDQLPSYMTVTHFPLVAPGSAVPDVFVRGPARDPPGPGYL